jgi:hypothetical protein
MGFGSLSQRCSRRTAQFVSRSSSHVEEEGDRECQERTRGQAFVCTKGPGNPAGEARPRPIGTLWAQRRLDRRLFVRGWQDGQDG